MDPAGMSQQNSATTTSEETSKIVISKAVKEEKGIFENRWVIGGSIAIIVGIVLTAAIWSYKAADSTQILGDWVVMSNYGATENMYSELTFKRGGFVSMTSVNYDDWDEGEYSLSDNSGSDCLSIETSYGERGFLYEFMDDGTLVLMEQGDDGIETGEIGVYINMSKSSEEEKEDYYYISELTDEESLHDYLFGKWEEVQDKDDDLPSGNPCYFQYTMDAEDDEHIRYNLPQPEREGEGFRWGEDNLIELGDDEQPAFLFMPRTYDSMIVYCYGESNYYDMKRVY